ncbi:DUF2461 domain-containing protein [Maribacter sp. 2307ULW6-5]|uniref:DUF2461 domain-containing protein n=1 Tax=Maribacter sp. 2307ULW6-5 TaxID=3386275 RepID=UPI0039BD48BC
MLATGIARETFEFLSLLRENNNREWFMENKELFKRHETGFKSFMEVLRAKMEWHDQLERLKVFRIYRDVRFSKDKTPYKSSFSGFMSRAGATRRGGYYVHVEPGNCFLGSGFWKPNKADTLRVRKEWEQDAAALRQIMSEKVFVRIWGKMSGEEVKTAPKGFDREHRNIDLIKKKQFIFTRHFSDAQVQQPHFLDEVNASFKAIRPFLDYMGHVLSTDGNGTSLLD